MLKIRLSRTGKNRQPSFRVVVQEHTAPIKGKFVESIGLYQPTTPKKDFTIDSERVKHWISVGARPSDTVATLLKKQGFEGMEQYMEPRDKKRKSRSEAEAPSEDKAEAKKEEAAEAPKDAQQEEPAPAASANEVSASSEEKAEAKKGEPAPAAESTKPEAIEATVPAEESPAIPTEVPEEAPKNAQPEAAAPAEEPPKSES